MSTGARARGCLKWAYTPGPYKFIMKNMFGNPPILELGDDAYPSEVLFPKEVLDVDKLKEVLGSA